MQPQQGSGGIGGIGRIPLSGTISRARCSGSHHAQDGPTPTRHTHQESLPSLVVPTQVDSDDSPTSPTPQLHHIFFSHIAANWLPIVSLHGSRSPTASHSACGCAHSPLQVSARFPKRTPQPHPHKQVPNPHTIIPTTGICDMTGPSTFLRLYRVIITPRPGGSHPDTQLLNLSLRPPAVNWET